MPLPLDAERILADVVDYSRRLGEGFTRMHAIGQVDVGCCPRDELYREDRLTLYRYRRPDGPAGDTEPLLIVYALVNRPYMVDLQPDRSLVRQLLAAGVDVYLIDWGYPQRPDRFLTLEDYVCGYLDRCVSHICERIGRDTLNLLGICQGGVLSLCYATLFPARVGKLVTMVTPVDFHTPDNLLTHLVRPLDIDLLVDTLGNVPGALLNFMFLSLSPFRLGGQKYVHLVDIAEDEAALANFLRMEKWIFDSPDQAGEAFRQFAKDCFQGNKLVSGELRIGDRPVDLGRLSMPVLNVYATRDHLVPPAASQALARAYGGPDYSEFAFEGGHIGIYVSARAQAEVPQAIAAWLRRQP